MAEPVFGAAPDAAEGPFARPDPPGERRATGGRIRGRKTSGTPWNPAREAAVPGRRELPGARVRSAAPSTIRAAGTPGSSRGDTGETTVPLRGAEPVAQASTPPAPRHPTPDRKNPEFQTNPAPPPVAGTDGQGDAIDRSRVERLYEGHAATLRMYARTLAPDVHAAEDAVQQVFLRLLSGGVPEPAEARPYLFRAVRKAALDRRRRTSTKSSRGSRRGRRRTRRNGRRQAAGAGIGPRGLPPSLGAVGLRIGCKGPSLEIQTRGERT
jgi:hypothetical protein